MSEAKTQPTTTSFAEFLTTIDPARHADCMTLARLMEQASGEKAVMWGPAIVGFGRYRYLYATGREGDWPIIGFSPRKSDLTLYLVRGLEGEDALLARFGKHKTSKACIYVKSLREVDMDALNELIVRSVEAMEPRRVR